MAEYVSKDEAMDAGTLFDWYISSIDETKPPVWTEEHIEELLNDFLVIPKDTPTADVRPERHAHWIFQKADDDYTWKPWLCSECGEKGSKHQTRYCQWCGAKMDKSDAGSIGNTAKIVNTGTPEKPYYQIEYTDKQDGKVHLGYGTKDLDIALHWVNRYFCGARMDGEEGDNG